MNNEPKFVDGHIEPTVGFPFDEIDRGNPLAAELEREEIGDMAEAFDRILFWCWSCGKARRDCKASFIRFVALTAALRPDIFNNASYKQIGADLKVSKAWMSKLAVEFQDEFGVHFRRSRREGARETFRNARLKSVQNGKA